LNNRTGQFEFRPQFFVGLLVPGVFHPFAMKILNFALFCPPLYARRAAC
jgi:hypothetical protein